MRFQRLSRILHRRGAVIVVVPFALVIGTGILLLLKKDIDWIQPPTQLGSAAEPSVTFDRILEVARTVPEAGISSWDDIDRIDVRPSDGMLKVRGKNRCRLTKLSTSSKSTRTGAFAAAKIRPRASVPGGVPRQTGSGEAGKSAIRDRVLGGVAPLDTG